MRQTSGEVGRRLARGSLPLARGEIRRAELGSLCSWSVAALAVRPHESATTGARCSTLTRRKKRLSRAARARRAGFVLRDERRIRLCRLVNLVAATAATVALSLQSGAKASDALSRFATKPEAERYTLSEPIPAPHGWPRERWRDTITAYGVLREIASLKNRAPAPRDRAVRYAPIDRSRPHNTDTCACCSGAAASAGMRAYQQPRAVTRAHPTQEQQAARRRRRTLPTPLPAQDAGRGVPGADELARARTQAVTLAAAREALLRDDAAATRAGGADEGSPSPSAPGHGAQLALQQAPAAPAAQGVRNAAQQLRRVEAALSRRQPARRREPAGGAPGPASVHGEPPPRALARPPAQPLPELAQPQSPARPPRSPSEATTRSVDEGGLMVAAAQAEAEAAQQALEEEKRKARREMDAAERSWSEERDRFEAERTQLEMEVSELVSADEHYAAAAAHEVAEAQRQQEARLAAATLQLSDAAATIEAVRPPTPNAWALFV